MNTKGQTIFLGLMLLITIMILALALSPALKEANDTARNTTSENSVGMDCSNSSISDFDKAACTASDLNPFLYVGILFGIAAAVAGAKVIFG